MKICFLLATATIAAAATPTLPPTKIFLHSPLATVPTKGSPNSAGLDLFSSNPTPITIPPLSSQLIPTDITLSFPPDFYGRIAERSGLALKHSIGVGGGVIDRDYRGKVGVIVRNFHASQPFVVNSKTRIAQCVVERCHEGDLEVVNKLEDLDVDVDVDVDVDEDNNSISRGDRGFGSSGAN
ncbi:hypothetical protein ScalyP_jg1997 [Parmales sp. scaly parma]|nr:hypothetical protein ScalyP_jg1997 [Parmales sp. scaly parma]